MTSWVISQPSTAEPTSRGTECHVDLSNGHPGEEETPCACRGAARAVGEQNPVAVPILSCIAGSSCALRACGWQILRKAVRCCRRRDRKAARSWSEQHLCRAQGVSLPEGAQLVWPLFPGRAQDHDGFHPRRDRQQLQHGPGGCPGAATVRGAGIGTGLRKGHTRSLRKVRATTPAAALRAPWACGPRCPLPRRKPACRGT